MVIWKGKGILVAIVAFAFMILADWLSGVVFEPGYYQEHGWPFFVAMLAAAGVVWLLAGIFNAPQTFIDEETGEEFVARPGHALFFIPMHVWSFILPVVGLWLMLSW